MATTDQDGPTRATAPGRGAFRRPLVAALALALLVAPAGCGGDDDDSGAAPGGTTGDGGSAPAAVEGGADVPDGVDAADDEPVAPAETSEEEQPWVDALVATYADEEDDLFTRDEVACVAAQTVATVGTETLEAAGLTPETLAQGGFRLDLADVDIPVLGSRLTGCADVRALLAQAFAGEDATARECAEGAIDDQTAGEVLAVSLLGDPEDERPQLTRALEQIGAACADATNPP